MAEPLPASAEDTVGPYYPRLFVADNGNDLTRRHPGVTVAPRGQRMLLTGRVLDAHGIAVAPVLVEFWQANAEGRFRGPGNIDDASLDPWFEGHARHYAGDGHYRLMTVKPAVVEPEGPPESRRAPHITLTLFCDGITRLVTQIFFAGEALNDADPLLASLPEALRARLIAEADGRDGDIVRYRRDIVLRGGDETPFFDDLES